MYFVQQTVLWRRKGFLGLVMWRDLCQFPFKQYHLSCQYFRWSLWCLHQTSLIALLSRSSWVWFVATVRKQLSNMGTRGHCSLLTRMSGRLEEAVAIGYIYFYWQLFVTHWRLRSCPHHVVLGRFKDKYKRIAGLWTFTQFTHMNNITLE